MAQAGGKVAQASFYGDLPVVERFERLVDPAVYRPVPEGWTLAVADIVQSTQAIEAGRYKAVNTAAAAVIAAIANALPDVAFPFVFGGDGASVALAPEHAGAARRELTRVAAFVRDELGLVLRVAAVPVAAIRAAGHDLCVARFAASPNVTYAMFSGGGIAWAEGRVKAGEFALAPAEGEPGPDLTGLSCRFAEIGARGGIVLSAIMVPARGASPDDFTGAARRLLALAGPDLDAHRPVPEGGPVQRWPTPGLLIEARTAAARSRLAFPLSVAHVALRSFLAHLTFRFGLRIGRFDAHVYRRAIAANTDFRKFDDGLRMTLDCTPAEADAIEAFLTDQRRRGTVRFGLHRQPAALMTCFVPVASRGDHVHFVDGAAGGYAMAARALKQADDDLCEARTEGLRPPRSPAIDGPAGHGV